MSAPQWHNCKGFAGLIAGWRRIGGLSANEGLEFTHLIFNLNHR